VKDAIEIAKFSQSKYSDQRSPCPPNIRRRKMFLV